MIYLVMSSLLYISCCFNAMTMSVVLSYNNSMCNALSGYVFLEEQEPWAVSNRSWKCPSIHTKLTKPLKNPFNNH